MTFYFEISGPFKWLPSLAINDLDCRFVWLFFSIGRIKLDYYQLTTKSLLWIGEHPKGKDSQ